ncbi:MAG: hypothetical protein AB9861_18660 [Methanosarcina sp.]|jgi:hypothetical protein
MDKELEIGSKEKKGRKQETEKKKRIRKEEKTGKNPAISLSFILPVLKPHVDTS